MRVDGDDQPTAAQISPIKIPLDQAQEKAIHSADWSGLQGEPRRALRTIDNSQVGTVWGRGTFNLRAALRKLTTQLFLQSDWPAKRAWFAMMAASYISSVVGVSPLSSNTCRKFKQKTLHKKWVLLHTSQKRLTI